MQSDVVLCVLAMDTSCGITSTLLDQLKYSVCVSSEAASLVVKVYPERVQVVQGTQVTLRCQVSGYPPHYFYWSLEDGRPISSTAERRRQGTS